ncbi:Prostaglandin F2 receptor negative regulator [Liparis tanakae]|uniref:Prostaglandin F2 receptor negative regulator n=1 Tax=Liparis tanakae TaxID=230148 RepID=A0A4Z2HZ32_9TELE|nr:Prostaglandin F2 receptor negative regulator [Liparis tanakae]
MPASAPKREFTRQSCRLMQSASLIVNGMSDTHLALSESSVSLDCRLGSFQTSDSGEYHCAATPWYLSASTGVWTQAGELTSSRIFLTVRFAVWESLKLPLLYGVVASIEPRQNVTEDVQKRGSRSRWRRLSARERLSLAPAVGADLLSGEPTGPRSRLFRTRVGVFSLVLGLVCAHCCCRNTIHTPRSRNKLMELEMD